MGSERLYPIFRATQLSGVGLAFPSVPQMSTLDAQTGAFLIPSLPGPVPHGGGSRDNRPDPILLVLPSVAGSEEEFLLLETQSL